MFKLLDFSLIVFDFDGVFTDNLVTVDENGKESVTCSRADGLGIAMLKKTIANQDLNIKLLVVSTEMNPVVARRCQKLGLDFAQGIENKKDFLASRLSKLPTNPDSPWETVLYLGNDLNDLEVMSTCTSFAPKDAHPIILKVANLVFEERGGHGFVRAAVEYLLEIEKMGPEELSELILNR